MFWHKVNVNNDVMTITYRWRKCATWLVDINVMKSIVGLKWVGKTEKGYIHW